MPNWTSNKIIVTGPKEALDKFISDGHKNEGKERVEGCDYSFSSWIPQPETYRKYDTTNHPDGKGLRLGEKSIIWDENSPIVTEELIEAYKVATAEQKAKYGVVGWYEWNVVNYGCKWDSGFNLKRISDTVLHFEMETPWTAPLAFANTLSKRYPELSFEVRSHYEEGFNEVYLYQAGDRFEVDTDYIQSKIYDYSLKKINEIPDSEERVLMTKCLNKFLADGYWYPDDTDYENQYQNFLFYADDLKTYFTHQSS